MLRAVNETHGDDVWFKDAKVLLSGSKVLEILPSNSMTYEERLNALVRFVLYPSVLIYVYSQDPKHLLSKTQTHSP